MSADDAAASDADEVAAAAAVPATAALGVRVAVLRAAASGMAGSVAKGARRSEGRSRGDSKRGGAPRERTGGGPCTPPGCACQAFVPLLPPLCVSSVQQGVREGEESVRTTAGSLMRAALAESPAFSR